MQWRFMGYLFVGFLERRNKVIVEASDNEQTR